MTTPDGQAVRIDARTAAAFRSRLDDPTRLENGRFHPRYSEWLVRPSEETNPWLHVTFDLLVDRLPQTDAGYLDTGAVRQALGPRWKDILGGKHLGAKPPAWTRLANLIGLTDVELGAHVAAARKAKDARDAMIDACRRFPYRLQSWEEVAAHEPCPGCGRPWLPTEGETWPQDLDDSHRDCRAGRNGLHGGPLRCGRCCGLPPLSPEVRARVEEVFAAARRQQEQAREAERQRIKAETDTEARIDRRAREIAQLEQRLLSLRAKQAADLDLAGPSR